MNPLVVLVVFTYFFFNANAFAQAALTTVRFVQSGSSKSFMVEAMDCSPIWRAEDVTKPPYRFSISLKFDGFVSTVEENVVVISKPEDDCRSLTKDLSTSMTLEILGQVFSSYPGYRVSQVIFSKLPVFQTRTEEQVARLALNMSKRSSFKDYQKAQAKWQRGGFSDPSLVSALIPDLMLALLEEKIDQELLDIFATRNIRLFLTSIERPSIGKLSNQNSATQSLLVKSGFSEGLVVSGAEKIIYESR
jgi:hypothetical protein